MLVSRKIDVTRTIIQPFCARNPVVPSCGTSLPRLGKIWDSLETNLERWCYLFGNLNNFADKPTDSAGFEDRLFPLLFRASAYANMNVKQQQEVTHIMRTELDRIAENEYARKQGEASGIEKGKEELAKQLLRMGVSAETIQKASGFTKEQIEAL